MSALVSGGQSIEVSALISLIPMNIPINIPMNIDFL